MERPLPPIYDYVIFGQPLMWTDETFFLDHTVVFQIEYLNIYMYSIVLNIVLDIYSIVPSTNVPLGIRLLAQGCLYNIIVKDGRKNHSHNYRKSFWKTCPSSQSLSMRNQKRPNEADIICCNKCFETLHLSIIRSAAHALLLRTTVTSELVPKKA